MPNRNQTKVTLVMFICRLILHFIETSCWGCRFTSIMGDPRDEVPSMEKYGASNTKSNGIAPPEVMYENAYDQIELNDLKKISQHGESSEPGTSEQTSEMTEEEETLDRDPNHPIVRMQDSTKNFFVKYGTYIGKITLLLMFVGYTIYFIYAVSYSYKDARGLIVVTSCVVLVLIYNWFRDRFGEQIWDNCMQPMDTWWDANFHIIKWSVAHCLVLSWVSSVLFVGCHTQMTIFGTNTFWLVMNLLIKLGISSDS